MSIKLNAQSGGSVALDAPTQTTSSADNIYKLPVADGSAGQVLKTDGSGNLSWTTPGITMADSWSLTSNFSQSAGNTDVTANWQRNYAGSTNWGILGSAMTESSGVFSFPTTGIYLVQFNFHGRSNGSAQSYIGTRLMVSQNAGVGYGQVVFNYSQAYASQAHFNMSNSAILDVTNTSNVKFKFNTEVQSDSIWFGENSSPKIGSGFYVIRLGDT
jgi:hypothetical protein